MAVKPYWFILIGLALCNAVVYREGVIRTKYVAHEALQAFLYGIMDFPHPDFKTHHGTSLQFIQIVPQGYRMNLPEDVVFTPPSQVVVTYPSSSFCIDYSAVVISHILLLPLSTSVSFTLCTSSNISLTLSSAPGTPFQEVSLKSTYSMSNITITNPLAVLFGVKSRVVKLFASEEWKQYVENVVKGIWKTTAVQRYDAAYQKYQAQVCYNSFCSATRFNYSSGVVSPQKHIEIHYDNIQELAQSASNNYTMEYAFPKAIFESVYKAAMGQGWNVSLIPDDLSENCTVRLDTEAFAQVIPDLYIGGQKRNLSVQVFSTPTPVHSEIQGDFIKFEGIGFKLRVNETLLEGDFYLKLKVKMVFDYSNGVGRVFPRVEKVEVKVVKLKSDQYKTVLKAGMEAIIGKVIDEVYMEKYKDYTLGTGIYLTMLKEKIDLARTKLSLQEDNLVVTLFYE